MPVATPKKQRDWAAVSFALVLPTFVTLAYFVLAASASPSVQQTVYLVAKTFQFAFPVVWVVGVQHLSLGPWPRTGRGIPLGLVFGLCVAVAMFALYGGWLKHTAFFAEATDAMRAKVSGMDLDNPVAFVVLGIFYSLGHSFLEEYYWRWFVFRQLSKLTPVKTAIVVSSLGFMAHHVLVLGTYFGFASLVTWLFSLAIAFGGGVWAWLYDRSGSLVGPWLSHLLVDAAIFAIGYQIAL